MKCGEPMPGGSYQDCDKELQHGGGHAYLGQRWPRVELAEPDWDVNELLDDQTPRNAYGVMDRSFPIIVTEIVTRVLWVDAETEDAALAHWTDDYSDMPSLEGTEVLCAELDFQRPDNYQRQDALKSSGYRKIGPLVQCPGCGAEAFSREWAHKPLRKCHGPIKWRETNSLSVRHRWQREYQWGPVYSAASQAVSA